MAQKTIRAIDLGYGNTKYTLTNNPTETDLFPSVCIPHMAKNLGSGADGIEMATTKTHIITIGSKQYEVGPGAAMSSFASGSRVLRDDYITSGQYLALAMGVHLKMNHTVD